ASHAGGRRRRRPAGGGGRARPPAGVCCAHPASLGALPARSCRIRGGGAPARSEESAAQAVHQNGAARRRPRGDRKHPLTPWRVALGYLAFGVLALALLALPLWYGWRSNLATFRDYVPAQEMQALSDLFQREGPASVAAAVRGRPARADEVVLFAGPSKEILA